MPIRAVVFDIGGVLEYTPEHGFQRHWEERLGLPPGGIWERVSGTWLAGKLGKITLAEVHAALGDLLGLDDQQAEDYMADYWREYVGVANPELIEYARGLRPAYRTGILSNSFVGAREREQELYGFEQLADDLVYSHEVGLRKPDPAIYALACSRLGVQPGETVFIDDKAANVAGAREAGLQAIEFLDNVQVIAEVGRLLPAA